MNDRIAIPQVTGLISMGVPKGPNPFYFSALNDPKKFPAKPILRGRKVWSVAFTEMTRDRILARTARFFMMPVPFSPTNWRGSMLAWEQRKATANLKAARS